MQGRGAEAAYRMTESRQTGRVQCVCCVFVLAGITIDANQCQVPCHPGGAAAGSVVQPRQQACQPPLQLAADRSSRCASSRLLVLQRLQPLHHFGGGGPLLRVQAHALHHQVARFLRGAKWPVGKVLGIGTNTQAHLIGTAHAVRTLPGIGLHEARAHCWLVSVHTTSST